jgi:hypothetical protein
MPSHVPQEAAPGGLLGLCEAKVENFSVRGERARARARLQPLDIQYRYTYIHIQHILYTGGCVQGGSTGLLKLKGVREEHGTDRSRWRGGA